MNKCTASCWRCGESVEVEDEKQYWSICEECSKEYEEDLLKDLNKNDRED